MGLFTGRATRNSDDAPAPRAAPERPFTHLQPATDIPRAAADEASALKISDLQARVAQLEEKLARSEKSQEHLKDPNTLYRVLADSADGVYRREEEVQHLRGALMHMQDLVNASQARISKLIEAAPATSRAGYLRSLPELIGPPASHTKHSITSRMASHERDNRGPMNTHDMHQT